jgi:hypothetical protein
LNFQNQIRFESLTNQILEKVGKHPKISSAHGMPLYDFRLFCSKNVLAACIKTKFSTRNPNKRRKRTSTITATTIARVTVIATATATETTTNSTKLKQQSIPIATNRKNSQQL